MVGDDGDDDAVEEDDEALERSDDAPRSPHDALFRAAFCQPSEAEPLVRALLPPPLAASLEPGSLELRDGAHVDGALRASRSDIVLAARFAGREALVILMLEHQSTVVPRMALRVMRYAGETWARHAKENGGPLPDLIPIVVYAGKRPWTAPRDVADLLEPATDPHLTALRPRFAYLLDDLTQLTEPSLRARTLRHYGALVLWSLAAVQRRRFDDVLPTLALLLHDLIDDDDGAEALLTVLRYLFSTLPRGHAPRIQEALMKHLDKKPREPRMIDDMIANALAGRVTNIFDAAMMRVLERQRAEGEARGRVEGEARGRAEGEARGRAEGEARGRAEGETRARAAVITRLLERKFGPLSAAHAARLTALDGAALDELAERVLFADTVEAALGE
jgi:hypothetical protein